MAHSLRGERKIRNRRNPDSGVGGMTTNGRTEEDAGHRTTDDPALPEQTTDDGGSKRPTSNVECKTEAKAGGRTADAGMRNKEMRRANYGSRNAELSPVRW